MKKTLLATALVLGVMATGSAFAGSFSLGGIQVNTPTTTTTSTAKTSTAATSANVTQMKNQIAALNNKLTSVSSTYETAVNDLVNNLVTADELAAYKAKVAKLKNSESGSKLNIDIAEDGSVAINDAIKSGDLANLKNLSAAKKAAIKKDLSLLKTTANNYASIGTDATNLMSSIQKDPKAALALHSDLVTLAKNAKEAAKQAKNITKLTATVTNAFAKSGIKL